MGERKRYGRNMMAAAAASLMLQGVLTAPGTVVLAEEETTEQAVSGETELQDLLELTAQEVETEEGSASSARLKIGDWLDYGDYGIERSDIPGTDYFFYITTADAEGNLVDDGQLGYCLQSYFLTPMPGNHSADMVDNVSEIGGSRDVQKVFYYGYGGAGYDADEFVNYLVQSDEEYYENVYLKLNESEQAELAYILTHGAVSYAYFTDGTSFEKYLELQFEMKYGDDWEKQLGYFEEQELELAGIENEDMNLLAATYGMNETGIALSKGWYQLLTAKEDPELSVTSEDGIYRFNGNEKNEELTLSFEVPDGFKCTVYKEDGTRSTAVSGTTVTLHPSETFSFVFTGDDFYVGEESDLQPAVPTEGILSGAEDEIWNLVLLETSKGTRETVDKRQQDIGAVSRINGIQKELNFSVELQRESVSLNVSDEEGQAVPEAVFAVFYDEECSMPVEQDGEHITVATDEEGKAFLGFVVNQTLLENGEKLFLKELAAPTGYIADDTVYCVEAGENAEITNVRETTSVSGTVKWNIPDGTALPEEISVELKKDGETADTQTVTADDGWSYAWDGLLKYRKDENGQSEEYDYSIAAEPVEGYNSEVDGNDIINTITGETVMEGQVTWHDSDDADELRPESITVDLCSEDAVIDSKQISEEDGWKYSFDGLDRYSPDGTKENVYTTGLQIPDGYTVEAEDNDFILTHPASVLPEIEIAVDVKGRDLKDGEFSFDLTQVMDETGENEAVNGVQRSAVNDPDGKVAFEDIRITEPGTYYYRITKTPDTEDAAASEEAVIAKAEVTAGGEYQDQLVAEVTYPEGKPEFSYTYTAGGEAVIDGIQTVLENGTLASGMFRFELKDSSGHVLQTAENDDEGKAAFEPLKFTEEHIGKTLEYTVSEVNDGTEGITFDSAVYTVVINVEDSEASDGSLKITVDAQDMVFTNIMEVPETETEMNTESETGTATETETETETVTEPRTEAVTESNSRQDTESPAEAGTEASSAAENQENSQNGIIWVIILILVVLLLILVFVWRKMKLKK